MKTFVLTGGASGIGEGIKKQLISEGHKVISIDLHNADIESDLGNSTGRQAAIAKAIELTPAGIDGFIGCAGVGSNIVNVALIPSVNFFGAIDLLVGLRDLIVKVRGSVVLISSNSAPGETNPDYLEALLNHDEAAAVNIASSMQGHPAYSGSKLALARWMRRNNADYAKQGIRLNAVAPGYIRTAMTASVEADPDYGPAIKNFVNSIPMQRPGEPEDIAKSVSFLLSDAASFVSGSLLFVDGGHDAMHRPDSI